MIRWILPAVVGVLCIVVSFITDNAGWMPDFEQFMIGLLFMYVALIFMNIEDIIKVLYLHRTVIDKTDRRTRR